MRWAGFRVICDTPLFKPICSQFGISSGAEFQLQTSASENVIITVSDLLSFMSNLGPSATSNSYRRYNKFGDDGGKAITGNLIYLTTNDNGRVERQFDFFMADKSEGLTQAGMARLNQSIEEFVYCILGAQANVR